MPAVATVKTGQEEEPEGTAGAYAPLKASNLGQIIGRALYGEPEPRRRVEIAKAPAPSGAERSRKARWTPHAPRCRKIAEFVRGLAREVGSAEIARACDIDQAVVCSILSLLVEIGEVPRTGSRGRYRYQPARAAP